MVAPGPSTVSHSAANMPSYSPHPGIYHRSFTPAARYLQDMEDAWRREREQQPLYGRFNALGELSLPLGTTLEDEDGDINYHEEGAEYNHDEDGGEGDDDSENTIVFGLYDDYDDVDNDFWPAGASLYFEPEPNNIETGSTDAGDDDHNTNSMFLRHYESDSEDEDENRTGNEDVTTEVGTDIFDAEETLVVAPLRTETNFYLEENTDSDDVR